MKNPFKKLSNFVKTAMALRVDNLYLMEENLKASLDIKKRDELIERLEQDLKNPKKVIEAIYGKGLGWYDPEALPQDKYDVFVVEAERIINSDIFRNIKNYLIAKYAEEALESADDLNDPQHIKRLAWSTLGLQAFEEYVEGLPAEVKNINSEMNEA